MYLNHPGQRMEERKRETVNVLHRKSNGIADLITYFHGAGAH